MSEKTNLKSVREQVEAWLAKAPKCIKPQFPVIISKYCKGVTVIGELTQTIVDDGFMGELVFTCSEWEQKK